MAVDHSSVELISDCFIKPRYEVEETKTPYYLLGEDLKWLSIRYIELGFLYKKPNTRDFNINSFVEKMKQSLSHALVYYYPLAGRFTTVKYEDEHALSVHVDCNKGPGARLIHASAVGTGMSVSDIISRTATEMPIIRHFIDLGETGVVDYDGHTRALVSLQVTELEDGVFIGSTTNHSVSDGTSWLHFLNSLSEIFRSIDDDGHNNNDTMNIIGISHVPIFKPVIPDGCSLIQKLPYLEPEEFISRIDVDPNLRQRIFHFTSSALAKLKAKVNTECSREGDRKISSFQALAALTWISINKARKVSGQEMTVCNIPIDFRSRFDPPLSPDHFGNIIIPLLVTSKVGELLENGVSRTALLLHERLGAYDNHQTGTRYMKAVMEKPTVVRLDDENVTGKKLNFVNFSGAARFDTYGVDFGLGRAVAIPAGNTDKVDGMVIANGGSEGRGSVDFEVSLMPHTMAALESDQEFMAYVS